MIKKFNLGAVEWSVNVNNEKSDDRNAYGTCDYAESEIILADSSDGKKRCKTAIEQTLYHEVTHAILRTLGYTDLSEDEQLVQQIGLMFHQFEKSKK